MLEEERSKASFPKRELSRVIYEGTEKLEQFLKMQATIDNDETLRFDPQYIFTERKKNMLVHAQKLIQYHRLFDFDYPMKGKEGLFFSEQMPLSLHFYMFLITLNNLCTEKQLELFFKPAVEGKIRGCYAQTELGHGSDIQNLMTTATYDEETETFIMHMPTTAAFKWWIGDLGVYANHAIVFAQLVIKNKKYGLHSFLVPLRDDNHNPFPGVQVGEIGPKYGYNNKDNGYLQLTNYRIPRRNMLMKYTKVSKSGVYEKRGNEKISYATMLIIRSAIPFGIHWSFTKTCVIAVRYSLYRTQFKNSEGKEIPILDYQLQQEKVFPRISQAFANMFSSYAIRDLSREVFNEARDKNKFDRLNEAHSLTSGLKAVLTIDALNGMEVLRRSLGGHGFSSYSGLPGAISEMSPTPTYEGQNTILHLQTARFLLKCLKYISKGKQLPPTVAYLQEIYRDEPYVSKIERVEDVMDPENLRKIFLYHSCEALKKAATKMSTNIADGLNPKEVWDKKAGLDLTEASTAHTYFWIFESFQTRIYGAGQNERVRGALLKLLLLYGVEKILFRAHRYVQTGTITGETIKILQEGKELLLKQIRPDALTIVEAFEYSDNTLHSAIGGAHEKPYETLMSWVKEKNEVNRPEVLQGILDDWKQAKKKIRIAPKL